MFLLLRGEVKFVFLTEPGEINKSFLRSIQLSGAYDCFAGRRSDRAGNCKKTKTQKNADNLDRFLVATVGFV